MNGMLGSTQLDEEKQGYTAEAMENLSGFINYKSN